MYGIILINGGLMVLVEDDQEGPSWLPIQAFEVEDPALPDEWIFDYVPGIKLGKCLVNGGLTDMSLERRVHFVVSSIELGANELRERLDALPDRVTEMGVVPGDSTTSRPAVRNAWELHEDGGPAVRVDSLLEKMFERIYPLKDSVRELKSRGCTVSLRIVLMLSEADDESAGFVVDGELLSLLASMNADEIDVDQYVASE